MSGPRRRSCGLGWQVRVRKRSPLSAKMEETGAESRDGGMVESRKRSERAASRTVVETDDTGTKKTKKGERAQDKEKKIRSSQSKRMIEAITKAHSACRQACLGPSGTEHGVLEQPQHPGLQGCLSLVSLCACAWLPSAAAPVTTTASETSGRRPRSS